MTKIGRFCQKNILNPHQRLDHNMLDTQVGFFYEILREVDVVEMTWEKFSFSFSHGLKLAYFISEMTDIDENHEKFLNCVAQSWNTSLKEFDIDVRSSYRNLRFEFGQRTARVQLEWSQFNDS